MTKKTRHPIESALEKTFDYYVELYGLPIPNKEYRFHPTRRWRFDRAWPDARVAVEIEGGVWVKGRHTRPRGFINDCDKYNAAAALGWLVFRIPGDHLRDKPQDVVKMVKQTIERHYQYN